MRAYSTSIPSLIILGYLCGDCKDGKGVSALLNRCVDCSNVNGILIAVLSKIFSIIHHYIIYSNILCSYSGCSIGLSIGIQRCEVYCFTLSYNIFY